MKTDTQKHTLKFCSAIDHFVSIKHCHEAEIAKSFGQQKNRENYRQTVVRCCLTDYEKQLASHGQALVQAGDPFALFDLEEEIFELCIQVNPHLALDRVGLPELTSTQTQKADSKNPNLLNSEHIKNLQQKLSEKIIGQPEAIKSVVQTLRQAAVGLQETQRPLANFLFAGTTGVGKTELAKTLTESVFGNSSFLIRIDGSEFGLPHEVAKLIGAPPGYVGHESGGQLTERVEKLKKGVVLIDEIEKADEKLHHMLLQILDAGHLTDSRGHRVSFQNFIIILTSNVGSWEIEAQHKKIGFNPKKGQALEETHRQSIALNALKEKFPSELLNRIDKMIVFNELNQKDCRSIIDLAINKLKNRCQDLGFNLEISRPARAHLLDKSYRPQWGAREIKRFVKNLIEEPLAQFLLDHEGNQNPITIKSQNKKLIIQQN